MCLALLVVASLAAPAAGGPNLRRDEEAFADWFLPTGEKNEFKWLGAYVLRSTVLAGDAEWFSGAGFVKGRCVRERTRKYTSISCESSDVVQGDPNEDFEMSPLATDATLRIRDKGRTHVVEWTTTPTHGGMYSSSEFCFSFEEGEEEPSEEGEGQGGGIWNDADAIGRLFGYRFNDPKQARFPSLSTGLMLTTCSFRSVDYDPTNSTLHVTFTLPR